MFHDLIYVSMEYDVVSMECDNMMLLVFNMTFSEQIKLNMMLLVSNVMIR